MYKKNHGQCHIEHEIGVKGVPRRTHSFQRGNFVNFTRTQGAVWIDSIENIAKTHIPEMLRDSKDAFCKRNSRDF